MSNYSNELEEILIDYYNWVRAGLGMLHPDEVDTIDLDFDAKAKLSALLRRVEVKARQKEIESIQAEAYTGIGTVRQMERRIDELRTELKALEEAEL